MKHALISTILLGAVFATTGVRGVAPDEPDAFEGIWRISPQICRGKPWSSTGKAAGWEFDAESGVCRAAAGDRAMIANVKPMEHGRFIVYLALQMEKDATFQVFLDEITFDLSDDAQTISVGAGPKHPKHHVERPEGRRWSVVRIERSQDTIIASLNGKEVAQFGDEGRSYERVGLKPIHGVTEINRFSLTGHLVTRTRP